MKKKLKLLMVFLLTFTFMTTNVLVVTATSSNDGSGQSSGAKKGGGSGGGGSSSNPSGGGSQACQPGDKSKNCSLTRGAGMRVSVMYRNENGTYTIVGSKTYLQHKYGYEHNNRTPIGELGKGIKMTVNYNNPGNFYGTRYEYLYARGVPSTGNWVVYEYHAPSNKDRDNAYLKKGNTKITQLDASWQGNPYTNIQGGSQVGKAATGYSFGALESFRKSLITDQQQALKANERLITQYITTSGKIQVGSRTIEGLGIANVDFNEVLCETSQVFLMIEPMITMRGGDGYDYLGTATELATLIAGNKVGEVYDLTKMLTYDGGYIDKNSGVGLFNPDIHWEFPMALPPVKKVKGPCAQWKCDNAKNRNGQGGCTKGHYVKKKNGDKKCETWSYKEEPSCKDYKCLRNAGNFAGNYGVGVQFDWIGWGGTCYTCYSETNPTVTNQTPVCNQKRTQVIEQKFVEDSSACENQPSIADTDRRSKEIHESGYLIGDTFPTINQMGRKYCGVYCRDIATVTYPISLTDSIHLNPTSNGKANGTAVWPDLNTHKLSVEVRKKCVVDINGKPDQVYINQCNEALKKIQDQSGVGHGTAEFKLTYTDAEYGGNRKFPITMSNVSTTQTGITTNSDSKLESDLVYKATGSLSDANKTYSVYNRKTNRYQIRSQISGGLQKYHNDFKIAQLAISEKSLNKAKNDSGAESQTNNNKMNIILNTLGYDNHLLVQGGKTTHGDITLGNYTCKYRVESPTTTPSCETCKSRKNPNAVINVCCLGPTGAQAYDTYCENGYLKKEYDDVYNPNYDKSKAESDLKRGILNVNTMENACSCTNPNTSVTYNMYDDINLTNTGERACMSSYYKDNKSANTLDAWIKAYQHCIGIFEKAGGSCSKPSNTPTEKCPENAKKHAGEDIPPGETKETWCTCATCYNACVCPARSDLAYTYITSIATRLLEEGKAKDYNSACKLAKNTSCSNGSDIPGGPGGGTPPVNASENYLYHTIDLTNPFVESSLVASSSDTQNRLPGSNWTSTVQNNETTLTTKYITSKSNIYNNNKPLYTIDLTPSVTSAVRNYNKNNDYSDFTLNCDDNTGLCKSTFLGKTVSVSGTMANQNFQNLNRLVKQNKEGK